MANVRRAELVRSLQPLGFWLRSALSEEADGPFSEDRPPLVGSENADVVVVGGGFTGLWTAWFLTEQAPGTGVTVLEQFICGGGPTGRNGGFATGWWDELPDLVSLYGEEPALRACRELGASIRAIGEWCQKQGVD